MMFEELQFTEVLEEAYNFIELPKDALIKKKLSRSKWDKMHKQIEKLKINTPYKLVCKDKEHRILTAKSAGSFARLNKRPYRVITRSDNHEPNVLYITKEPWKWENSK